MRRLISATALLGAVAAFPQAASAVPIVSTFTCASTTAKCNGNEYGWSAEAVDANTWQITVAVKVNAGYTGNQWTDRLNAITLKSFSAGTVSNLQLLATPTANSDWAVSTLELNSHGCAGGGSGTERACFEWNVVGSYGVGFTAGDILSWTFQFDSTGALNDVAHIKYLYVDSGGKKVGDLGSYDLRGTTTRVPEPGALALLGAGLAAFGLGRLRARR